MRIAVSLRSQNENGNIQSGKVLLIRKVLVNGDQDFVGAGCSFQEIAIFQSFESCLFDGVHLVAGQIALEMARYALVKQQLHFRAAFRGEFQNPINLFAGDGGKLVEKLIYRFARFDTVEQVLNWNPGARKTGVPLILFGFTSIKFC